MSTKTESARQPKAEARAVAKAHATERGVIESPPPEPRTIFGGLRVSHPLRNILGHQVDADPAQGPLAKPSTK